LLSFGSNDGYLEGAGQTSTATLWSEPASERASRTDSFCSNSLLRSRLCPRVRRLVLRHPSRLGAILLSRCRHAFVQPVWTSPNRWPTPGPASDTETFGEWGTGARPPFALRESLLDYTSSTLLWHNYVDRLEPRRPGLGREVAPIFFGR